MYTYDDGSQYIGDFDENGIKNGKGHIEASIGATYEGQLQKGLPSSLGVMRFPDSSRYECWYNEFLIKVAKEKNPPNLYGKTPLHVASEFGHLDICQLIGGYINDKNPRDKNGMTPLQLAEISTSRNRDKIVQYFNSSYLNSLWETNCNKKIWDLLNP